MSKTIDDRIVRMSFDTGKFQNGVKGVLDGLKSIDKSLGTKRTFAGLDGISKSISDITGNGMTSLGRSISEVSGNFSALEIAGVTALANISNRAVNAGINLIKSLTLDPIMEGFGEYETKMQSIQTILTNTASKGTTLKDVTKTLDELNEYADKTIYNFAAMTKNIGTFTAAGIDLEKATLAIKGIANLGAGVGSTNQQVETAMYQMSQALSQGYLMLQDYNSLVNAGMGGELFKKEAIAVAKSMGIATPAIKDFRTSLEDKWLTDDVMMKVFENFANNDMLTKAATEVKTLTGLLDTLKEGVGSGWAQTWEAIVGDKDQATKLFTGISNAINNGLINPLAEAREQAINTWLEMGGRENTIKGFANIWENLSRIIGPVGEAFGMVFPKNFGELLGNISKGFLKLTESIMISEEFSGYLGDAFSFLFKIVDKGIDVLGLILSPLKYVFNFFVSIGQVVGSTITAFIRMAYAIGEYISKLTVVQEVQKLFNSGLEFIKLNIDKFVGVVDKATKNIRDFFNGITDYINGLFNTKDKTEGASEAIDGVAESSKGADKAMSNLKNVGDFVAKAFDLIKSAGKDINKIFNDSKQGAENAAEGFKTFLNNTKDYILNSSIVARATVTMTEAWKTMCDVGDRMKDFVKSIDFSPIVNTLNSVKEKLSPIVNYIKNIFDILVDSFKSVFDELDLTGGQLVALLGGFAAGFGVFKILGKIGDVIGNILNPVQNISEAAVGVLEGVRGVLESYQNRLQADTLKQIGIAVLFLSGGLLILSQLELSQVQSGLLGVVGILAAVVTSLAVLIKITSGANLKGFFSISAAFVTLSIAVMNMSLAVMLLSSLGIEKLSTGLLGLAGGVTIMVLALGAVGTMTGSIVKGAFAMTLLANALNLMFLAISLFGRMDVQKMNNSLLSVGMSLGILVLACKSLGSINGSVIRTSTGLTILAGALIVMAKATEKFGNLDTKIIFKGLMSISIIMGALILFNKSTANSKMSFSMGAGMMGLAKSLDMLAKPIERFAQMKLSELVKGIGALGLVMGSLTLMTNFMTPQNGLQLMGMSIGLMLFAGAIAVFAKTAVKLNSLKFEELANGLINMSLALVAISLAMLAIPEGQLIMLALGIGALSIAMELMTKTVAKAGSIPFGDIAKGIAALMGGLLILEGATRLTSETSLIMLGIGLSAIALGFTAMVIPLTKLGSLDFKTIAKGLASMFGMIGLLTLANMGMGGINLAGLAVGITLMSGALSLLIIPLKMFGAMELEVIGKGLLVIAGVLGLLGVSALLMAPLVPVLFGLASSITLLGSGMLAAAGGLMLFSAGFALFAVTVANFGDEVLTFFMEFGKRLPELVRYTGEAFVELLSVLGQNGQRISESVYLILEALLNAFISVIPLVANAVVNLVVTIVDTITSNLGRLLEAGYKLVSALLDGINKYVGPIIAKAVEILITFVNALNDNLTILVDAGIQLVVNLINGMANGIESNSEAFAEAVSNLIYASLGALADLGGTFFERGVGFVGEMISGLFDGEKEVKDTSTSVAGAGVDGAETTKPEWKSAGVDFSAGVKKGIESGKSGVVSSATLMARSAANAVKKELDINSPSRVTTRFGKYTSQGLALGISKFGYLAEIAGTKVAENAARSIEQPMNNISLLDGINIDPVIKPVLDLSNIKSGSRTIGDLLNSASGTISMFGSINSGLATNVGIIQNGNDNSDIVTAISKLRKDINNIKGTTNIIDGITYDDGSAISNTISDLVRMARVERRR